GQRGAGRRGQRAHLPGRDPLPPGHRPRRPVRRPPASSTGAGFVAAMVASAAAAADVSAARALAVARAEQAELVRERWTAAAQRTKGLERLKERHEADLRRAADVAEARVVDDLVTRQHGASKREREEGQRWTD
ncbi:hypothetical protein DMO24_23195, partial [Modestobacter versicolor]